MERAVVVNSYEPKLLLYRNIEDPDDLIRSGAGVTGIAMGNSGTTGVAGVVSTSGAAGVMDRMLQELELSNEEDEEDVGGEIGESGNNTKVKRSVSSSPEENEHFDEENDERKGETEDVMSNVSKTQVHEEGKNLI